jgi:hypothetical protein
LAGKNGKWISIEIISKVLVLRQKLKMTQVLSGETSDSGTIRWMESLMGNNLTTNQDFLPSPIVHHLLQTFPLSSFSLPAFIARSWEHFVAQVFVANGAKSASAPVDAGLLLWLN